VKDAMREGASNGIYRVLTKKPERLGTRRSKQPAGAQREAASGGKSLERTNISDGIASLNTRANLEFLSYPTFSGAVPENIEEQRPAQSMWRAVQQEERICTKEQ